MNAQKKIISSTKANTIFVHMSNMIRSEWWRATLPLLSLGGGGDTESQARVSGDPAAPPPTLLTC